MLIRPYRRRDAKAVSEISATFARSEADFALNPLWENEEELEVEFARFDIEPESHLLVADAGDGEILGFAGFLREAGSEVAGLICPVVRRGGRRRGIGGELLRAAQDLAVEDLGIEFVTAGIGTRNRAGYSLLASHGFRPVRQHFFMRCDSPPKVPEAPFAGLTFAVADAGDADDIHAIYRDCGFDLRSPEAMHECVTDGRHMHFVARSEGRTVAFTELQIHWKRRLWVAFVGVASDLRDRGVGSALVAWALEQRFEAGAESAMLLLSPANRTALRSYEKVGFRRSRLIDVLEKSL
jgi:ribosomal protein S18 acetylase RimI-like enzyme